MKKNEYIVLGVMSGTSLDGIDIALVQFNKLGSWSFKIDAAVTVPYSHDWKVDLANAITLDHEELQELDERYTTYLAKAISRFIKENEITNLDAVCSHGHTIKHEPENGLTLQIGNLPELAELTGQTVVCDFRVQDVALGGEGAPLVPIGDELLFPEYQFCLNLGGFANVSTSENGKRMAYDICAVNTVLNYYAEKLGEEYDKDGAIARSGYLNPEMLEELESLHYYNVAPPKSLGIEWLNKEVLPILKKYEKNVPSILRTYSLHVAMRISKELGNEPESEVLVSGGGCLNIFLIQQIRKMTQTPLVIPSLEIINFKEAIIFGFLGVLKMRGEVNVLSSVTGAENDHSSGVIYVPN